MLVFPVSTDAPVYYWPIATVSLVAVNVVVFAGMIVGTVPDPQNLMLWYGQGLHPLQWLTSNFVHAGLGHLLSNMFFLWVFGLVVEGKLGWWKYLACFLGIGVTQSMLEQLVMLDAEPSHGSCGASAIVYGLMAMSAIWAPKNEITFFYMWMVYVGTFDVAIAAMAVFYVCMEIVFVTVLGSSAMTSILHLSGAAIGLPLGIALLKLHVVDCEGWDAFHVWSGDYGSFKKEPEPVKETLVDTIKRQSRDADTLTLARPQLRDYLKHGNVDAALKFIDKMKNVAGGLTLNRDELLAIIKGLHVASRWRDSAPWMAELIDRFPTGADPVRVKLAQICVVELNRPGKALDYLAEVDLASLPPQQAALAKKIAAKAEQMQANGVFELDTEAW